VDRVFSIFSVYDFVGYIFTGGALIVGVVWAIAGVPQEPSAAGVIGLAVASYMAGHLVQAAGAAWERLWWRRRGGLPSTERMTEGNRRAYPRELRDLIIDGLVATHGDSVRSLPPQDLFALARSDLHAQEADVVAERVNMQYAFNRGLTTVGLVLASMFIAVGIARGAERMLPAAIVAVAATVLFLYRFNRFGFFFADQIWHDYAASVGRSASGVRETACDSAGSAAPAS
jgi:hypothetical protein